MTKIIPVARRTLGAVVLSCALVGLAPAASAVAAPAPGGHHKHHVKVDAKLDHDRVRKGESTTLRGNLTLLASTTNDTASTADTAGTAGASEPLVVQELRAGAWVDIRTTSCRPNGAFAVSLRFDVSAKLSLRVFHPETEVAASAYSSVFAIVVL